MFNPLLIIITSLLLWPTIAHTQTYLDNKEVDMTVSQQANHFYIKYYPGKQTQVIELVDHLALSLIDIFSDQEVLLVEGKASIIQSLHDNVMIEYIEPVPQYSLLPPSMP